jgi:hypothetical protein
MAQNKFLDTKAYWYVGFSTRYGFKGNPDATYKVAHISSITEDRLAVSLIAELGNAKKEETKQKVNWIMEQRIKELTSLYGAEAVYVRKRYGCIVAVTFKTQDFDKVKC